MTVTFDLKFKAGLAPGFDFVRLFLALSVLTWHALDFTHQHAAARAVWASPLGPLINAIVPCFFALSGFLVTGSLIRLGNLRMFLIFRGARIIPALLVEIALSALIQSGRQAQNRWCRRDHHRKHQRSKRLPKTAANAREILQPG